MPAGGRAARHFDAMIHLTGWGDKRLMFRFPFSLLDLGRQGLCDPLTARDLVRP
jgi:hypothetical protein